MLIKNVNLIKGEYFMDNLESSKRAKKALEHIKKTLENGKSTKTSDWIPLFGAGGPPNSGYDGGKFRYGFISKKRCKEICKMKIGDPNRCRPYFDANREYFVANKDESLLFCQAFSPRPDMRDTHPYDIFLYFIENDFYYIKYEHLEVHDEERNKIMYRIETINIFKNEFIDKRNDKEYVLSNLKAMISKNEENSVWIPNFKRVYEFTFYYDGEKI